MYHIALFLEIVFGAAFVEGEFIHVLKKHDSGWLEVRTPRNEYGYMSPAWVRDLVSTYLLSSSSLEFHTLIIMTLSDTFVAG